MAGMGGAEVGRVHIRVVPDFTHFRKEMLEELKQWDNRKITWKLDADTTGFDKVSKQAKELGTQTQKAISQGTAKGVKQANKDAKVKAEVSPSVTLTTRFKRRMQGELEKAMSEFEVNLPLKVGKNKAEDKARIAALREKFDKDFKQIQGLIGKLEPEMDRRRFAADAAWIKSVLNKLKLDMMEVSGASGIKLQPNLQLKQQGERIKKKIEENRPQLQVDLKTINLGKKILQATRDLKVKVNTVPDTEQFLAQLNQSINAAKTRVLKMPMDVDTRPYWDGIRSLEATATRINLDLNIPLAEKAKIIGEIMALNAAIPPLQMKTSGFDVSKLIPSFGTGLNPAAIALAFGAALMLAAPIIGLITTGLLTIPGILATFMAPIAAVTLGFKGIQKAAENAGLFADKNGEKKGGGTLGEALTSLQAKVESVFEKGLTEPFKKFGAVANTWVDPLVTVAQGTVDIFKGMINSVTSELGSQRIAETFTAVGDQLSASFAPGIQSFSDALIGLAHTFTTGGALEGVGTWFKDTMADFSNWVNEMAASGQLTTMFEGLGASLKVIADALGSMALEGLDFMKDPGKVRGFTESLKGLGEVLKDLVGISEGLAPLFKVLELALKFPSVAGAIVDWGNQDRDSAEGGVRSSQSAIAAFNADAAKNAPKAGAAFQSMITAGIVGAAEQPQQAMATGADAIAQAARDGIGGLGDFLRQPTQAALAPVAEIPQVFTGMFNEATAASAAGAGSLQSVLTTLGQNATVPLQGIPVQVTQAFTGLQGAITGSMGLIALSVGAQSTQLVGIINNSFATLPTALGTTLGGIVTTVTGKFNGMAGAVRGALSQLPGIVSNSLGSLGGITDLAMVGVVQGVQKGCDAALLAATFGAPKIIGPFKAIAGEFFAVGAQMMTGLAKGITGSVGFAEAAAAAAAKRVKEAADRAAGIRSPSREFMKTGDYMMQGMQVGIENGTKGPVAAMREVMQAIKDVFGSAEGINLNFFMGQAASSMSSMADSSKEFRSNIVDAGTSPILSDGQDGSSLVRTEAEMQALAEEKAANALRIAELRAQKNATADKGAKAAIQSEIDALNIQQQRINLIKEEQKGNDKLTEQRKTAIQQLSDTIATNIQSMIKMPGDFATATIGAASQDLGVSGSGAIPTIANWAMDAGTNFIFNVSNMDDALAGQRAQQNRQAAGVSGR